MAKKKTKKTASSTRKPEGKPTQRPEDVQQRKKNKRTEKLKEAVKSLKNKTQKITITPEQKTERFEPKPSEVVSKKHQHDDEVESLLAEIEASARPQTEQQIQKLTWKNRLAAILLLAIGAFVLIFVATFLFGKFFKPQALADLLPEKNTVALIEINTDSADDQVKQVSNLLKKYPVYQRENLIQLLNTSTLFNFEKNIEPWLGRKIGLAFLSDTQKQISFEPVLFVESRNHEQTLSFLTGSNPNITSTEYKGIKIYSGVDTVNVIFQNQKFAFINNYLVLTEKQSTLENLIKVSKGEEKRLADEDTYRRIANNLPQGSLVFGYYNTGKIIETLLSDPEYLAKNGREIAALRPFIDLFAAEGFTVFAQEKKLNGQIYTSLNREKITEQGFMSFQEKYRGELLKYITSEPVLLVGGHDLVTELSRLETVFKTGTKASSAIFNGLVEAQKDIYFGKDISLTEDIYPLLKGEYLISVEGSFETPTVSLLLKFDNPTQDQGRFEKLIDQFMKVGGIFTPKVRDVTLPDGTKGQEIAAFPEKITRLTDNYQGILINTLQIGNTGSSVNYAFYEDKIFLSNSSDAIKNFISRGTNPDLPTLEDTNLYKQNITPMLANGDQFFNLKLGSVTDLLGLNSEQMKPYTVPFTNFTISKNYFNDGISTLFAVEVI